MSELSDAKIKLSGLKVIFANLEDEGFGKSITVDATDPTVQKEISDWVKKNNIGKGKNAGVANFKEYEKDDTVTIQYSFRMNDNTKIAGLNGLDKDSLGYGSVVSIVANAFEYNNKFGKGFSASLSAVLVERAATTGGDADLADLLSEHGGSQDVVLKDIDDGPIDLADIPFGQ